MKLKSFKKNWAMSAKSIFLTLTFFIASDAFSWGKTGHRIVAHFAERQMSETTKNKVKKILGFESVEEASLWPDRIKSVASHRKKYSHKHYISFEKKKTLSDKKLLSKDNIISALESFEKDLGSNKSSPDQKKVALRFIIHLIGDLHQPLHVGYNKDKGGNSVGLKWFGEPTNLHRVWDEHLIDMEELSYTEYVTKLLNNDPKVLKSYNSGTYLSWAQESRDYLSKTYNFKNSKYWEYDYSYKHLSMMEQRLSQAGVRLASTLSRILK